MFSRTELLIGSKAVEKLANSRVAVFGVGGVGGYVVEALARTGVGSLDLIDNDTVSLTNINRQIIALHSTIGKDKVEVMRDRILDINPNCKVNIHKTFYLPETAGEFDFTGYDYVVDAVDTVTAKLEIIANAKEEASQLKEKASKDVEQERQKVMNEIKNEISNIAVLAASKVIEKDIDSNKHKELIDNFIKEVGESK